MARHQHDLNLTFRQCCQQAAQAGYSDIRGVEEAIQDFVRCDRLECHPCSGALQTRLWMTFGRNDHDLATDRCPVGCSDTNDHPETRTQNRRSVLAT
jgi:hypothetical protein